jgi:hypothetical protein
MGPFKFSLVAAVLLALSHGTLAQLNIARGNGGLFGGESGGDLSSGDHAGYPGETNGYLPPIGSGTHQNGVTAYPPSYSEGETNQGPEIQLPPVQPQLGCAAALICVEEQLCSMTGIILESPISLTEEQKLRRVPMVDCRNPDNGVVGKCCRDPNYVDPWPAGNLPANYTGGFDEQGFPKFLNLSKNKNNKKPIVPQKPFQNQPRPFQNQPTGFTNQPLQPQSTNQSPTNHFVPQPQSSSQVTVPATAQGVISHRPISPVGQVTPLQPVGTPVRPVGTINKTPVQPVFGVTMNPSNPFLQPTQRPIVVAEQPQKTFPGFPSLPSLEQIPNVIAGLNPFKPDTFNPTDTQTVEAPQDVPNVPFGDATTKKPGFFPNFPNFGFGGKVTANTQAAQAPVIAPHTPGAQCGITNQVQHAGGLDDVDVAFGEIPWQAMILSNAEKKLLCSGAIVAPNVILTAAHCVYGHQASDVSVKAGEWKLGYELKHEEPLPFEIVQVKTIEVHPNYQPGVAGFDVAILFLQSSFKLDLHVDTICVGQTPVINPQRKCISTGWGKVVLQSHAAGSLMHKIDVDVIGNDQCRQRLQGAESALDIDDSLVCVKAHRQNNNMCQVDVGGPLACDRGDGNYEIVGVYSQDTGCLPTNQVATFALVDNWVTGMISNGEQLAPQATIEHGAKPTPIVGQSQTTFQQHTFQQSRPIGQVSTTVQQGRGPTVGHIQTTYQPGSSSFGGQAHTTFQHGSTPSVGQTQITFQQAPNPVVGQTQTTFQQGSTPGVGQVHTTFQQGSTPGVGQIQSTFQQTSRPAPITGQTPTGFHHQVSGTSIQQSRPSPIAGQSQVDVQQINKIHYHPNQPDVPCDCQQGTQPAGLNQYLPPV